MREETEKKYGQLKSRLKELGQVAVAFSSGVDSTLLLKTAKDVLGTENVIAVTASSGSFPQWEKTEAKEFCIREGIRQFVVVTNEMEIKGFRENPANRCYLCKKALFTGLIEAAKANGIQAVAEGSNMDDLGDYRPGLQAIRELGVLSPLREAGLYKAEIREISKELGLPTASKPSFACLASRFVYGEEITPEKLRMVEKAEALLMSLGFEQMRVRIHGTIARIETLPEDMEKLMREDIRIKVVRELKAYGFSYVSMDLGGYRTGSMNEMLSKEEREKYQVHG